MIIMESLKLFGHSIFMSAKPTNDNLKKFLGFMLKNNINTVVSLLSMKDIYDFYGFNLIKLYEKFGLSVIHYPIEDFSVPKDMMQFDNFIDDVGQALKKGSILIHCSAGLGRTGLVTSAILIKYLGYNSEKSMRIVRNSRFGAVETPQQEHFLDLYNYYLNGDNQL